MLQTGSIVELMLGSNFANPGFLNSNPGVIQSFVSSSGKAGGGPGVNGQFQTAEDFIYNESMLLMLRNWTLTQSILNTFKTTIQDIYLNSDIRIDTGLDGLNTEINDFIKSIGLIKNIVDNLEDDLYYGQRAFYLNFESKSIMQLSSGREFDQVKLLGKPFKYRFKSGKNKVDENFLVEYSKICSIMFNSKLIGMKKSDKPVISSDDHINKLLCDIEYYRGNSILKNVLYLLFQHFLKSLLASLLSIKNTVKPNLLKAEIQPGVQQELNIVEAINNIEALLNNGEYTFDFRTSNAAAIVSSIYNAIVNSVKVVPGISNYTNFDTIQQPDETNKIESLNRDVSDLQTQILNLIGIPEELYGGSGNKWEALQRSTRYNAIISSLCNCINDTIKQVAASYIRVKKEKNVAVDSIQLNMGAYNSLYASGMSNKLQVLSDSLNKIADLMNSINGIKTNELCDVKGASDYIKDYLTAVDNQLVKLVDFSKFKLSPPPTDTSNGSGSGTGSEGGWE